MKKTMKLIALFVCAMATVALTGCGKEPQDLIVGKWNVDRMINTWEQNGRPVETEEMDFWRTLEFNADGTVSFVVNEEEKVLETYTGTWQLSEDGTKLTIVSMGIPMILTVEELTKTNMHLWYRNVYTEEEDTFVDEYHIYMSRA